MNVQHFYDTRTNTLTYIVFKNPNSDCVVIDPVLDLDVENNKVYWESAEKLVQFIEKNQLTLKYILETHVHADHLTASAYLKAKYPAAKVVIGSHVDQVQNVFNSKLNIEAKTSDFDILVKEGDRLDFDGSFVEVIETPGHTPACVTYKIEDNLFTGDSLFMPDSGTGRCDFPLGSASKLYESIMKIFKLPSYTKIFVGHDYQPGGRALRFETSVGEQISGNIHLKNGVSEKDYVQFREGRDKTLSAPKLLEPSLKVNLRAGRV